MTEELLINMGPQHPSTHGVLKVELRTDGEIIREAKPEIGFLHRCFEKHAENVDWMGVAPFVDRLDYLSAMNNSMGYAIAVEKLLGIEVPRRAEYTRIIVCELQRIASHLMAFGTYGLDVGAFTSFMYGFREREKILDIFEAISGARLLYNYMWIGGVMRDLTAPSVHAIRAFLTQFRPRLREFNTLLTENEIFIGRTANIAVLNQATCFDYGLTGAVLRGSGFDWDLRRDEPYSAYSEFRFSVPVGRGIKGTLGDCWDRHWVRMQEIEASINLVEQALDGLPDGPHRAKVPKLIKAPPGEVYSRTECPRGELAFYIISEGGGKPARVKVKSPCFLNLSTLPLLAKNSLVADFVAAIGSLDVVMGEVDR